VYIIDEVHMLSKSAFNAMLKTLEEPPAHVKFILATTDPQKIPVTVLSRCLQFNLKQLPPTLIFARLQYVLKQENISFEAGALALLSRAAQGSMRDALSLLDQAIAYSDSRVDEATVRTMLGAIDQSYLFDLLQLLQTRDGAGLLRVADNMALRSLSFEAALQDLATLLHRIALAQTVPLAIAQDEPERDRLLHLAQQFSAEEIQLFYQIAIHGRNDIDLAPDEYAGFTMTLLRMLAFIPGSTQGVPEKTLPQAATPSKPPLTQPVVTPRPVQHDTSNIAVSNVQPEYHSGALDWGVLLAQLNVLGMAKELAKNCTLESFLEGRMTLNIAPQHKHLQSNKNAQDKLQAALAEYFTKPIKLLVTLGATHAVTPAVIQHQEKQVRQQQATDAIMQDPFVQEAQVQLGAQVIESSIKSIQQESAT
jgi:DNA polymerase-3 subunit gamma/tau